MTAAAANLRHDADLLRSELAPDGWHDLTSAHTPRVEALRYPPGSIVVVAGIPGAGKSTLLHRLFGTDGTERGPAEPAPGVLVLDSEQVRNRWRDRLGAGMPYRMYRPLVHLVHTGAVLRVLAASSTVVLHDCGTRGWWRRLVLAAARARGTQAHLILLDVPPVLALDGQQRRARTVRRGSFDRHVRRYRELTGDTARQPTAEGFASCVVLSRGAASRMRTIRFADFRHPGE